MSTEIENEAQNEHANESFTAEENRRVNFEAAVSRAIDRTGLETTVQRADAVTTICDAIDSMPGLRRKTSDRGWISLSRDGDPVDLTGLVAHILVQTPHLADQKSVCDAIEANTIHVKARSDLKTDAQRSAYLRSKGFSAFAALPQERTAPLKQITAKNQLKTDKEKSDYLKEFGMDSFINLPLK